MKKSGWVLTILGILLVIDLILFVTSLLSPDLLLQPVQTPSQVTVNQFFAIELTPDLASGIVFNPITQVPLTDNNASRNNAGLGQTTLYGIRVLDSSVNVTICASANRPLTNDGNGATFGLLANETYLSSLTNTPTIPGPASSGIGFTTTNALMPGGPIGNNQQLNARFHVDAPTGVQTGTYTNTITFTAQVAGSGNVC